MGIDHHIQGFIRQIYFSGAFGPNFWRIHIQDVDGSDPLFEIDFAEFLTGMRPQSGQIAVFSKTGAKPFWSIPCPDRLFLVFGSETRGLPAAVLNRYAGVSFYIPITSRTRSLNLSTAAGIALYESLRLAKPFHAWPYKLQVEPGEDGSSRR